MTPGKPGIRKSSVRKPRMPTEIAEAKPVIPALTLPDPLFA